MGWRMVTSDHHPGGRQNNFSAPNRSNYYTSSYYVLTHCSARINFSMKTHLEVETFSAGWTEVVVHWIGCSLYLDSYETVVALENCHWQPRSGAATRWLQWSEAWPSKSSSDSCCGLWGPHGSSVSTRRSHLAGCCPFSVLGGRKIGVESRLEKVASRSS